MPARVNHAEEIYAAIGKWVASLDLREVEDALNAAGVPGAPVLNMAQIFEHPMIQGRGSIVNIEWEGQDVAMVDVLPRLSRSPGRIRSAAPRHAEHTTTILQEIGLKAERIAELTASGVIGVANH
jgi:crotonobetainyl-CoA:carnitine CoA-transferase CaiB-like acyl-CoA transferase